MCVLTVCMCTMHVPVCIYVYHVHNRLPLEVRSPEIRVINSHDLYVGAGMEPQSFERVLFTAEGSLQPYWFLEILNCRMDGK